MLLCYRENNKYKVEAHTSSMGEKYILLELYEKTSNGIGCIDTAIISKKMFDVITLED